MVTPSPSSASFTAKQLDSNNSTTISIQTIKVLSKMNHPFIYMCFALWLWISMSFQPSSLSPLRGGGIQSVSQLSNNQSQQQQEQQPPSFEMSPLVRIDGTVPHNPYSQVSTRPIMYTFFNRIEASERHTGMDDASDDELLRAWQNKWNEAGWNAIILDMEDAKRHPRYQEFEDQIQKVPMNGTGGSGLNRFYNELCFYRWLAVAAVGGGWMSDYDVFPLAYGSGMNKRQPAELPSGGTFSVYSIVSGSNPGAGIPCLMSGSASEWERMAFTILQNGIDHQTENHWTDMFALMDLRWQKNVYLWTDEVVSGQEVLIRDVFEKKHCGITNGNRAVHFSHSAMEHGHWQRYINGGVDSSVSKAFYRPETIMHWLDMWDSTCEGKVV
mmetsp:Transcript_15724/g.19170  ORF Transcript_15724/g.19170 Transcript_15724/m.19170 type:complete len:384 (+) Transcript_15724:167-1318(+)